MPHYSAICLTAAWAFGVFTHYLASGLRRHARESMAMELLAQAAKQDSTLQAMDESWYREYYLLTGKHMILTAYGWEPGCMKEQYREAEGDCVFLDEVNKP